MQAQHLKPGDNFHCVGHGYCVCVPVDVCPQAHLTDTPQVGVLSITGELCRLDADTAVTLLPRGTVEVEIPPSHHAPRTAPVRSINPDLLSNRPRLAPPVPSMDILRQVLAEQRKETHANPRNQAE